jgi:hypothetical protein
MATSPGAEFINAACDLLPAVTSADVSVLDGYDVSDELPNKFLMVGSLDDEGVSLHIEQTAGPIGNRARDEVGTLSCIAYVRDGNGDQRAARDEVFEIAAAAESLVRVNFNLGIQRIWKTEFQQGDFQQDQDEDGAWALVGFSLIYAARI